MTSSATTATRSCDLCLGSGIDELFDSTCGYCSGTGAWTPSPYRSLPKAMTEAARPEFGTGPARSAAPTAPATQTWGWTKVDGTWAALAPLGATIEAGTVTLTTKAGKTSEVYVTGKVLARLRYGLVVEMGTAPAAAPAAPAAEQELAPAAAAPTASAEGLDLSGLVSGRYAVPGGDTRLKLEVDVVAKGKWAGWVFVRNAAEYGPSAGERLGAQRPGQTYKGKAAAALAAVLADPKAAMAAYGHLTGTCGACGRHLEDEASIAAGMGPVCAKKW